MLTEQINGFIEFCKIIGFKERSIQALSTKLKDFNILTSNPYDLEFSPPCRA